MSTNAPHNQEDQEIDLLSVFKKTGDFFEWLNGLLFRIIRFFVKKGIIISILLIVGTGIGMYLDNNQKIYDNQIIVQPNFGSTDYLYSKIDLIDSKIKEKDTFFLKSVIGISEPKNLKKIEIKPIVDVYKFIESKKENIDLIKLLAEDSDIKKIIEDNLTSKNYSFHTISFKTGKLINKKEMVQPILNFLNQSDYYKEIQTATLNNIRIKMSQNDTIISQINGILDGFSYRSINAQKSDKLIYYNENIQLNDIIKSKDTIISEQGVHRIEIIGLDKIIKDKSTTTNIEYKDTVNGKLKLVLPVLFVVIFILGFLFMAFYKKQSLVSKQIKEIDQ